jgi:DNA repair protein RecO (recombination protein O)
MLNRVEGIVIRSTDYGEGNKILVLLAKELGKISVMARGAKKPKSRLGAAAQLFTRGEYTYFKSGGSGMGTLNAAEIIASHHGVRENLRQSAYAAYLAEMADRMLNDMEGGGIVFGQLAAGLDALEAGKDPEIVAHIFEMTMLREAGCAPVFAACVQCGGEIGEPWFSISAGGGVCPRCRGTEADAERMDSKAYRLLQLLQRVDLRMLGSVAVSKATKQTLNDVMSRYMDYHIGLNWRSRNFIRQMEKYDLE